MVANLEIERSDSSVASSNNEKNNYDATTTICSEESVSVPHEIFGDSIGRVFEEYACYNVIHSGLLYTGSKAICFFSNKVFGFERRLIIPLETITDLVRVEKKDICIKTNTGVNHTFKDFQNRDVVLTGIYELAKNGPGGYATAQRNLGLIINMAELDPCGVVPICPPICPMEKDAAARSLIESMAELDPDRVISINRTSNDSVLRQNKEKHDVTSTPPVSDIKNGKQQWLYLKGSKFESLKDTAIRNIKLSCSLDVFFSNFFDDDAIHSIEKFQSEKIGDFDINTSIWETPSTDAESFPHKFRSITYKHPMNIPMAPPSARAIKEQKLYKISPHGICIETCTTSFDAPTTDCFTVHDAIIAESCEDGGTMVQIKFEVRFVKNTMFQAFVELTTRKEFKKWFKGFTQMMMNKINEEQLDSSMASDIETIPSKHENEIVEVEKSNSTTNFLNSMKPISNLAVIIAMLLFTLHAIMIFSFQFTLSHAEKNLSEMMTAHNAQIVELSSVIEKLQKQLDEHAQFCNTTNSRQCET